MYHIIVTKTLTYSNMSFLLREHKGEFQTKEEALKRAYHLYKVGYTLEIWKDDQ